jgi:UDP-N-acetylmuramyl pentapeptide synthase
MQVLVLDTIHGGRAIAAAYAAAGATVDAVDVYRGTTPEAEERAKRGQYDLVTAPVHLDPNHPLLLLQKAPVITHHEAVRRLLGDSLPHPMIEITGAQGKTTTAHALAHVLPGPGILHTSAGTYRFPGKQFLVKMSITPASVLSAAARAREAGGWLLAEESLGVTGAGDLAIITSGKDYPCANGKKSALAVKLASVRESHRVLLAPGIAAPGAGNAVHLDEVAGVSGRTCTIRIYDRDYRFENTLLLLDGYRIPLALAGTAAALLGYDPAALSTFPGIPGRMSVRVLGNVTVVDNSNSGTNAETTIEAARYARACTGKKELTLVIGQAESDGAVCEGFGEDGIARAIREIGPDTVIRVGGQPVPGSTHCTSLFEAEKKALETTRAGAVVLAVKTWR